MIKPTAITDFNRSDYELQEFLLFCVCVAGKSSEQQAKKLDLFLNGLIGELPFNKIINANMIGYLVDALTQVKMGQYNRISKAFIAIAYSQLDLKTCTVEQLEAIPGIGPKTARFFLLHSRSNQEYAVLDTHILAWMRSRGWKAPKATPSQPLYGKLEVAFLAECVYSGLSPATLDLMVWKARSQKSH